MAYRKIPTLFLALILPLWWCLPVKAADPPVFPIDRFHNDTIFSCHGILTDSGGDTLTTYAPNEDFTVLICSSEEDRLMRLSFLFFDLGAGDTMYIFDGDSLDAPSLYSAQGNDLAGQTVHASGPCLRIRFVSSPSGEGMGFWASMDCYDLCDAFGASMEALDGLAFCPYAPATARFRASAWYLPAHVDTDPQGFTYRWYASGNQYTGTEVSVPHEDPGIYPVNLQAHDPLHGCRATALEFLRVSTQAFFDGTQASVDTACAGEGFVLSGMARATTWAGLQIDIRDTLPIPDGTGATYVSSLTFDAFAPDQVVRDAGDIGTVCLFIEHADYGQLRFELESPLGSRVRLHDYSEGGANLGEPVIFDPQLPGRAYSYCFSPAPEFATMAETAHRQHAYTDRAGNYYFNADYLPEGSYTPLQSLDALAGSPLNGTWTMHVTDHQPGGHGHMMGWRMLFNEDFYADSLLLTPEITDGQWYRNDSPLTGNPASVSVEEPGEVLFRFAATDNLGCTWDTTLTVYIRPLPQAEIISELELPFCEGDSTLLTVVPRNGGNDMPWTYQWMLGNDDIPGRTYDTLMVKQPGIYGVMVRDTITGCFKIFDLDVTDQNCDLTIPNVFTPNGDGINDYFEILNLDHYPNAHIVIYNRWGKKVFEHNDYYNNWWDGRDQPDGVYFYVLRYHRMGKTRYAEGAVTIVR